MENSATMRLLAPLLALALYACGVPPSSELEPVTADDVSWLLEIGYSAENGFVAVDDSLPAGVTAAVRYRATNRRESPLHCTPSGGLVKFVVDQFRREELSLAGTSIAHAMPGDSILREAIWETSYHPTGGLFTLRATPGLLCEGDIEPPTLTRQIYLEAAYPAAPVTVSVHTASDFTWSDPKAHRSTTFEEGEAILVVSHIYNHDETPVSCSQNITGSDLMAFVLHNESGQLATWHHRGVLQAVHNFEIPSGVTTTVHKPRTWLPLTEGDNPDTLSPGNHTIDAQGMFWCESTVPPAALATFSVQAEE